MSKTNKDTTRWDAYRNTFFRFKAGSGGKPFLYRVSQPSFGIITAWNPGRTLSRRENDLLNDQLNNVTHDLGHYRAQVIGQSRDGEHQEKSWVLDAPVGVLVALGKRFGQEAIFHVKRGSVYLVSCIDDTEPERLGRWDDRLLGVGELGAPDYLDDQRIRVLDENLADLTQAIRSAPAGLKLSLGWPDGTKITFVRGA